MKSSVCHQKERNNTSKVIKGSNQSIRQDTYLINHISKLAADHDVTVSGTMIKVTYKKSSRDHLASPNCVDRICYNDDSMLISNNKKFINSVIKVNAFMDPGKTSIRAQTGSTKTDSDCKGFADTKKKAPILLGGPSGHPLFHLTPKRDSGVDDKKLKGTINGISLLKKFESLKELNSYNKSTTAMKPKASATQISLTQKPVQVKAGTSDKFPSSLPTIKIPKGITIIRVKGNAMPRDDKVVKRANTDKIILSKERRKQNINVKRKIPMGDSVVATKIMKKIETNSQVLKSNKQLKNYSDITGLCETIISEDMNEDSMYSSSNSNSGSKKEILMEDPELPQGWRRVVHTRYEGTPFAKHVVYIYSPQGKKFQFKWKLRRYLERMKSPLSAEQFHFGLYKRAKPLTILPVKDSSLIENDSTLNIKTSVPKTSLPSTISKNLIITKPKAYNLKHSDSVSRNLGRRLSSNKTKAGLKNNQGQVSNSITAQDTTNPGSDEPQLLFYDPDLPFGWKRVINSKSPTGKLEVNIISPEGKIFRRRYRLHEYLNKQHYNYNLDRFYFGLYPKKDPLTLDDGAGDNINKIGSEYKEEVEESEQDSGEELNLSESDMSKFAHYATPMYDDPNLPEGWKRFIKIRACGRNAGKMEVVIVSPSGKRIRSKGQLENYIQKNELNYNPNDFNFSVFGHPKRRPQVAETNESINIIKRRNTDRPIPDFDINAIKESKVTAEGEIINKVAGIMISCGLSSGRSERRLRIPRKEHEKNLKTYLESENDISFEGSAIPTSWIQKLVKCRSDFRNLEADAAITIANSTKEFIKELSLRAFEDSDNTKSGLQYENLANIVDKYESLSYLKTLIPRKISYKEYLKLNRPKQFLSFT